MMKILPPILLVLCIPLMILLNYLSPIVAIISSPIGYILGFVLVLSGSYLTLYAVGRFRSVHTPIRPFVKSTTLVVDGPYRFTRNPMYVGFIMVLTGIATALGSISPYLVVMLFARVMHTEYVLKEEPFMEELFGNEYILFKKQTKRWI